MRGVRNVVLIGVAALALSGCLRQSASYEINPNGTVDATISIGMHEDYVDPSQPYNGITVVQTIRDHFTTDTIVDNDYGEWVGYRIYLDNEPMSSFADPATASWDLQILGDDSDWVVYGVEYDPSLDGQYQTIVDQDGYVDISVTFPGDLVEEDGAVFTMVPAPGVAQWNMATITEQPYARGRRLPAAPPEPPAPDPDPVVTVVITPSPHVTPVVTPNPSPTPSAATSTAPSANATDDGSGVPVWIWGVGGGLLVVVAGLVGYIVAKRPGKATPPATPSEPKAEEKAEEKEPAKDDE